MINLRSGVLVVLGGLIAIIANVATAMVTQRKEAERDRIRDQRNLRDAKRDRLTAWYTDLILAVLELERLTWVVFDYSLGPENQPIPPGYTIHDRIADELQQLEKLKVCVARLSLESGTELVHERAKELWKIFGECRRYIRLYEGGEDLYEIDIEKARNAFSEKQEEITQAIHEQFGVLDGVL